MPSTPDCVIIPLVSHLFHLGNVFSSCSEEQLEMPSEGWQHLSPFNSQFLTGSRGRAKRTLQFNLALRKRIFGAPKLAFWYLCRYHLGCLPEFTRVQQHLQLSFHKVSSLPKAWGVLVTIWGGEHLFPNRKLL